MFDLNFISDPGLQNETSHASWSFLHKKRGSEMSKESDSKKSNPSFIKQNSWKNYAFVLIILGFIALSSIINIRYNQMKPDLILNHIIDLIIQSGYISNLQLVEANFSTNQIKVTIRSEDFTAIQSITQVYRMENEIPYEMFQKGKYSYINLIFPWKGNEKGGDIQNLKSIAEHIGYSKNISINHSEDIFEIQGQSSDIISFILQMAENEQIQKFNFSVFHHESDQFNLKVK